MLFRFLKFLSSLSIVLAIFTITRQFPFNLLGFKGIPKFFVFFCFLFGFPIILNNLIRCRHKVSTLFTFLLILLIGVHGLYSLYIASNPLGTLRFFLILNIVILSYYLRLSEFVINWFMLFALVQSLFLIIFEIYLLFFLSPSEAAVIRQFFLANNIGDVYTYNGFFYRIQILGNPLIPFAFFVSFFLNSRLIIKTILLLGVLISANFAFYMATLLFLLCFFGLMKPKSQIGLLNNIIKAYFAVFLSAYPMLKYIFYVIEKKKEHSLRVREDQLSVLINDMSTSTLTTVFGKGLGNLINIKTPLRDYTHYGYYFELQTVYIFNQLGILAIIYFVGLIYIAYKLYHRSLFVTYLCYILYAITNPYIMDSTHVIVILILNILQEKYYGKDLCNSNNVQA